MNLDPSSRLNVVTSVNVAASVSEWLFPRGQRVQNLHSFTHASSKIEAGR